MGVHHRSDTGPFRLHELVAIRAAKQRFQQRQEQPLTERKTLISNVPLLPAPPCAGLLPAPGHTSSPFTNPKDKLMIGGVVFAVGKGYVMGNIEAAIAAQRKALKLGLFKRAEEIAVQKAKFAIGAKVHIRHGRTGTILRILTDGRCVVRINEMSFLAYEYYTQDALAALNVAASKAA